MRNSKSKTAIVELLEQSEGALSHKDIQTQLKDLCDRVTVYRVLDRLVNEGRVHKVIDFDGVMRFAACHHCGDHEHSHNHVHFSCESCNKVFCLDTVKPQVDLPDGYQVKDSLHVVSGVCAQCSS
ncbi:Fur family transcriptional regulator [Reichenbachiella versicolor]|uniref:Fur family transcriptional regulator n=1 Tax=Reichenbachiella versicolor TaxID=1821036 RepID=UPI000D6E65DC|nr:transcriptional repressor [Reichenbachiella versicolor]